MSTRKEFLQWIHDRLHLRNGDAPNLDHMIRLEGIINALSDVEGVRAPIPGEGGVGTSNAEFLKWASDSLGLHFSGAAMHTIVNRFSHIADLLAAPESVPVKGSLQYYLDAFRGIDQTVQCVDPHTGDWASLVDESALAYSFSRGHKDIRIKPELEVIDFQRLQESCIDCTFWTSDNIVPHIGALVAEYPDTMRRYECQGQEGTYEKCAPRYGHWQAWQGGECPIPEGFIVEIMTRNGESESLSANAAATSWNHKGAPYDIIQFRVMGVFEKTHVMPWDKS